MTTSGLWFSLAQKSAQEHENKAVDSGEWRSGVEEHAVDEGSCKSKVERERAACGGLSAVADKRGEGS
jgi:hypothetical protein